MRFGFVVPNWLGVEDPAEVVRLGVLAEALGFDSVWVAHHVLNLGYVKKRLGTRPYHDALMTLAWIGSKTERVKLGTSVLVMPYLHPAVLAKELATLDQLSGGRLIAGLGAGGIQAENEALGVPFATRGQLCNEFIQALIELWTNDEATFVGEHFAFENVCSSPKPAQAPHPLIVIGGNKPAAIKRAARYGGGWHPMVLRPEAVAEGVQVLQREADALGRLHSVQAIQVRLDMGEVNAQSLEAYRRAGVTDLVMHVATPDVMAQEEAMKRFAEGLMSDY